MGLAVQAHCGSVKLDLLNTHMESTADHAEERKKQLEQCLGVVSRRPPDTSVIFGGDLNMRDKELASVGGLPTLVTTSVNIHPKNTCANNFQLITCLPCTLR